jgi:DNA-binding LacI/PurR family transcriptional regulator
MNTNLTQRELAKQIGYSYLTVNRALGNKKNVGRKTREKILMAAEKLGYRKNALGRNLKLQKSFAIGMIGSNSPHGFWVDLIQSLERRARDAGYHIIICHHDDQNSSPSKEIDFLLGLQVEGLIFCLNFLKEDLSELESITKSGVSTLLLDQYIPATPCSYLGTNSKAGTRKACEYLLNLGHRRIMFVSGPAEFYTCQSRLAGYREALNSAGLKSSEQIIQTGFCREHGEAVIEQILSLDKIPTAIMAVNDPVAIGLYFGLTKRGIRVPHDISLVGYSGDKACELLPVPLTTVAQPSIELGRRAAEIIIAGIENAETGPVFEELEDELILRSSCCPPI